MLSPYLSLALSLLRFPFFLHPQHCPQIRQGFSRGELETVRWWSVFFFFQSLFLDSAHAPPVARRWGLLKGTVTQFLSTSLKFKFFLMAFKFRPYITCEFIYSTRLFRLNAFGVLKHFLSNYMSICILLKIQGFILPQQMGA